jgi:gluconolactonase
MLRKFGSGLDHPEGVAYSETHGLFCGGEAGQIYSLDLDSGDVRVVANTGGFLLGLAFGPAGKLFACDMGRSAVLRIDVATGEVEDISSGGGVQLTSPNHLAFGRDGTLYISDSGEWGKDDGRLVAFSPPEGPAHVVADGLAFPNGLALDATGESLYVVESSAPGVSQFAVTKSKLGTSSRLIDMPATVPDGLAVCHDGSLVISCYRPDAVYSWSLGHGLSVIASDWTGLVLSAPTNIVFAGKNRDHLITANLAGYHLTEIADSGLRGLIMEFTS